MIKLEQRLTQRRANDLRERLTQRKMEIEKSGRSARLARL